MKGLFLALAGLTCCACALSRPRHPPRSQPALIANVSYFSETGIGIACLPRGGDSTNFEIDVVVDSLREKTEGTISLVRGVRSRPQPGYIYQAVTVEIQRAGRTRVFGTSCWHDAGIVVRGTNAALANATISLDAPATVLVRILDSRGRSLEDDIRSTQQGHIERIRWASR